MAPIWIEDVIFFLLVTFIILIPVGGITARFALRPIVDALLRLREGFAAQDSGLSSGQYLALQAEIQSLRSAVLLLSRDPRPALHHDGAAAGEEPNPARGPGRIPFSAS